MNENISINEALELVLCYCKTMDSEIVAYREALHRILREDISATSFHPPSDNSAMDGFAVKASDCSTVPAKLKIIGTVFAGEQWKGTLQPGKAIKIMTGASIPDGADAIVPFEEADEQDGTAIINARVKSGDHIRRKGEDFKEGDVLLRSGKQITASDIAVLASAGITSLKVSKKPVAAIFSTGNELVNPEAMPAEGKIRDSNCYGLEAQVKHCGAMAEILGIARDEKNILKDYIIRAMRSDLVLISGGISKGTADYVKEVMEESGAQIVFSRVRQRPGYPFTFSILEKVPVFLLPGNPVSSMICFELYIRPFILKMMKADKIDPLIVRATLEDTITVKKGRTDILRVIVRGENGKYTASLTGAQGSDIITSMVKANGLLIVPEDVSELKKGEEWPVRILC